MKAVLFVACLILCITCSCVRDNDFSYKHSANHASNLIARSIEATLESDKGPSDDGPFLIDFSRAKELSSYGIQLYLELHPYVKRVNLDSLLISDTTRSKYGFLEMPVIRIDNITPLPDDTILIETSKTKSMDGAQGSEIILEQKGNDYHCISNEITWISWISPEDNFSIANFNLRISTAIRIFG